MKRFLAALAIAALALSLCACNKVEGPYIPTGDGLTPDGPVTPDAPPKDQALTMVYYPNRSMNPYTATDYTNRALLPLLYQSLFSVDRNYNCVPILCKEYSVSQDMQTWTFYIENALFSDGTTLTADDVAASLQAATYGQYYKGRFQHVTSITAEQGAVVIRLSTPCQNLPILLDVPIVKADQVNNANPIGTGPYILDKALSGMRLRRQAAWWCSGKANMAVTATYIPLVEATSPSQIRDQFQFADVGLVCTDPGSDLYADYRCDYELWEAENGLFLYMVCHKNSPVFSNDTVRKALTHAIDRDLLVEEFYRDFARSTTLPASPSSPYYNANLAKRYGYDPEIFTNALTEAGMQGAKVTMLLNMGDSLRLRAGRRIAKMLTDCGLEVELKELAPEDYEEHLRWSTYDLYLGQTKLSPNMDLSAFFRSNGGMNYGGLANSTIHAMALEALTNSGNYYNLHQLVMEDAHLCPILVRSYAVYATRGLVTNLTPARDNLFFYTLGKTMADAQTK